MFCDPMDTSDRSHISKKVNIPFKPLRIHASLKGKIFKSHSGCEVVNRKR